MSVLTGLIGNRASLHCKARIVALMLLGLAAVVWFATAQIAKGAYFHELDLRFTQGILKSKDAMDAMTANHADRQSIARMRDALLFVRQQPTDCFAAVNALDRVVMTMINTIDAVHMCSSTIVEVNGFLGTLDRHQATNGDPDRIIADMTKAITYLTGQSERFVELISKTVTFIVRSMTAMSLVMTLGVAIFVLRLFKRSIIAPIQEIQMAMQILANGGKDVEIPAYAEGSEMGHMAETLKVFRANLIENERLQAAAIEDERRRKEEELRAAESKQQEIIERQRRESEAHQEREQRAQKVEALIGEFQGSIRTLLADMNQAVGALERESTALAAVSTQSMERVHAVGRASQTTSANVETVAGAAQELDASIRGIAEQVERQKHAAEQADGAAASTEENVNRLAEEVRSIGDIIDIINNIAEQTNLLALNATIEAARAGEAGKGFAVVASEVKTLASQTAKATEDITRKIQGVQNETSGCVSAIQAITTRIRDINKISAALENAVTEQSGATNEIARSVTEAANGTADVSDNMGDVSAAIEKSGAVAKEVLSSSRRLSEQTGQLDKFIHNFVDRVQAA